MRLDTALRIAGLVRDTAEQLLQRKDRDYTCGIDPFDLRGACSVASGVICKVVPGSVFVLGKFVRRVQIQLFAGRTCAELEALGIRDVPESRTEYRWLDHCWTTLRGQIIDVTATQFGVRHRVYSPVADKRYRPEDLGADALQVVRDDWGWNLYRHPLYRPLLECVRRRLEKKVRRA